MCMKGESDGSKKNAEFTCKKCGAVSAKKKMLCHPKKIKE